MPFYLENMDLINGKASQHLQYLPYGESFVEQKTTATYYTPYRFSGKEKDEETQYSYFGARYYDADLSVWLSVDPMASSRSWISPYNYCQWNPVMRVDPSGALDWHPDNKGNLVADAGDDVYSLHVYLNRYGQVPVPFELVRRLYGSMYHGEPISDPKGQMISFASIKKVFGSHAATMFNPATKQVHQGHGNFGNGIALGLSFVIRNIIQELININNYHDRQQDKNENEFNESDCYAPETEPAKGAELDWGNQSPDNGRNMWNSGVKNRYNGEGGGGSNATQNNQTDSFDTPIQIIGFDGKVVKEGVKRNSLDGTGGFRDIWE